MQLLSIEISVVVLNFKQSNEIDAYFAAMFIIPLNWYTLKFLNCLALCTLRAMKENCSKEGDALLSDGENKIILGDL